MNWEHNWMQQRPFIQRQWKALTDDDLDLIDGDRYTFIEKLQERYGYALQEAEQELRAFEDPVGDEVDSERYI
jgi:hypothetical protein